MVNLKYWAEHVGHLRLELGATTEVGVHGGGEQVLVAAQRRAQCLQSAPPRGGVGVGVGSESSVLAGVDRAQARDLGLLAGRRRCVHSVGTGAPRPRRKTTYSTSTTAIETMLAQNSSTCDGVIAMATSTASMPASAM